MSANTSPTMSSSSIAAVEVRAGRTAANSAIARMLPPGIAVFEMPIVTAARASADQAHGSSAITSRAR